MAHASSPVQLQSGNRQFRGEPVKTKVGWRRMSDFRHRVICQSLKKSTIGGARSVRHNGQWHLSPNGILSTQQTWSYSKGVWNEKLLIGSQLVTRIFSSITVKPVRLFGRKFLEGLRSGQLGSIQLNECVRPKTWTRRMKELKHV